MRSELQNLAQRSTSRSISGQIGAAMQFINNYGCWCFFDENYTLGKSKPMDQMDSYCRDLHNGYDCIIMDVNETCIPYDTDYNSGLAESGTQVENEGKLNLYFFSKKT